MRRAGNAPHGGAKRVDAAEKAVPLQLYGLQVSRLQTVSFADAKLCLTAPPISAILFANQNRWELEGCANNLTLSV